MKYRLLTLEELEPLKEEFLKYLLVANITPDNWEQLKKDKDPSCDEHLEVFSDMVLDKILQEVLFVDIILKDRVEAYQFTKDKAFLYALENKKQASFDFTKEEFKNLDISQIELIKGSKTYSLAREEEIFQVLQKEGASISKGELFKKVALLSVS